MKAVGALVAAGIAATAAAAVRSATRVSAAAKARGRLVGCALVLAGWVGAATLSIELGRFVERALVAETPDSGVVVTAWVWSVARRFRIFLGAAERSVLAADGAVADVFVAALGVAAVAGSPLASAASVLGLAVGLALPKGLLVAGREWAGRPGFTGARRRDAGEVADAEETPFVALELCCEVEGEVVEEVSGEAFWPEASASATAGLLAIATPIPNATASAPTRPTCIAKRGVAVASPLAAVRR